MGISTGKTVLRELPLLFAYSCFFSFARFPTAFECNTYFHIVSSVCRIFIFVSSLCLTLSPTKLAGEQDLSPSLNSHVAHNVLFVVISSAKLRAFEAV